MKTENKIPKKLKSTILKHINKDSKEFINQIKEDKVLKKKVKSSKV